MANSWRTTPDIRDEWRSVMEIVEINARRWRYARPGAFNDPDMLEVKKKKRNKLLRWMIDFVYI